MTYSARRLQRTARALRSIGDLSDYLSGMCRVLHRHRLRLEQTTPAYQLPAAVASFRAAIEAEIERQEIGAEIPAPPKNTPKMDLINRAAMFMFHATAATADEMIALVQRQFPSLTLEEVGQANALTKSMLIAARDHLKSEIEAGRIPVRKDTLQ